AVPLEEPHAAQNLAWGRFSPPPLGPQFLRALSHSIQNLAPSGVSESQPAQRMRPLYLFRPRFGKRKPAPEPPPSCPCSPARLGPEAPFRNLSATTTAVAELKARSVCEKASGAEGSRTLDL